MRHVRRMEIDKFKLTSETVMLLLSTFANKGDFFSFILQSKSTEISEYWIAPGIHFLCDVSYFFRETKTMLVNSIIHCTDFLYTTINRHDIKSKEIYHSNIDEYLCTMLFIIFLYGKYREVWQIWPIFVNIDDTSIAWRKPQFWILMAVMATIYEIIYCTHSKKFLYYTVLVR